MLEQLLNDYGYLALFIGTFLEGETIVVLSGLAAASGYLSLSNVIIVAFVGSFLGDQLWYILGRFFGINIIQKRPKWQVPSDKALYYLRKRPDLWVLTFRFMYGLRTIMPFAIGMSGYPIKRYILLNGIGAVIWSATLSIAAFYFGEAVKLILLNFEHYKFHLIIAIALAITAFVLYKYYKKRKSTRSQPTQDHSNK